MKRYGNLWENLICFENLFDAATKACKGKRFRPPVLSFHFNLEKELWQLHEELAAKNYRPGDYRTFFIHEPKKRQISAAPYRDRVVHHALTNVLEPIFERTFIHDSYACRKGKGTHAAVKRCQEFARRFRPTKNVVFPVRDGIRFLGYRVFPSHRLLVKENVRRFRRRLRQMQRAYAEWRVSFADIHRRIMSWIGHARQANSYRLRSCLFDTFTFQRATAE